VEEVSQVVPTRAGDLVILESISFAIPVASFFCITGPSGSGKSALLRIVAGIERPTHGRVMLAGHPLSGLSESELARRRAESVGVVFSTPGLIATLTVRENILLALELGRVAVRREWENRARVCLDAIGMAAYADSFPDDLSAGLQQRAAIGRSMANDPVLFLADEPTSGLDSRSAAESIGLLRELADRGKTVVYTTRDHDLASLASDHIGLLDGRIETRSYGALHGLYA
jgi:putative ABC transport system ATP-binding protein